MSRWLLDYLPAIDLALFFTYLFFALLFLVGLFVRRTPKEGRRSKISIAWQKIDYFYHFMVFLAAILAAQLSGFILGYIVDFGFLLQILLVTLVFMLFLLALTVAYLRTRLAPGQLGTYLSSVVDWDLLRGGFQQYLGYYPLIVVVSGANYYLLYYLDIPWNRTITYRILSLVRSPLEAALVTVLVVFVAPPVEELFFRGSLYRLVRRSFSASTTALLTGFVFAVIHFELYFFPTLFLLGYLLGRVFERKGNLGEPVAFHACHNMLVLVFFYGAGL